MTGRGENPVRRISASLVLVFSKDIWPDAFLVPKICTHFAAEGCKFFRIQKRVCRDLLKTEVYCRSRCAVFEMSPIVRFFWRALPISKMCVLLR